MPNKDDTENEDYDHDFEAEQVCTSCGETSDNCDCGEDSDFEEEFEDSETCAICGYDQSDPCHGEG